jgi:hypothetical protein
MLEREQAYYYGTVNDLGEEMKHYDYEYLWKAIDEENNVSEDEKISTMIHNEDEKSLTDAQQYFKDMHDRLLAGGDEKSLAKTKLLQEEHIRLILDENTRSKRTKWAWTKDQRAKGTDIINAMNDIRDFWPLGERQIYYRLISSTAINQAHWHTHGNPKNPRISDVCGAIGTLLKWLRINVRMIKINDGKMA